MIGKKICGVLIFVVMGTIVVRFAKYARYCGLIFVDKRHTTKSTKFLHIWYTINLYACNNITRTCHLYYLVSVFDRC